ncbi:MAG TPA: DNA cytosine methyltransferase [Thauera aminoaromatica]|nr:DNA cytosine methyltransferase [Thauera aminoaromatica]
MRVLDLFSGAAGGWSLGLHRAGFTTVAACEIDEQRRAAYAHNNPGVRLYDDVRSLTAGRLLADLGYLPECVAGSPPCQDASTANSKGRGIDGERTGLFRDFVRIVGEVRPRWVAAENVPGLRTRGADWVLDALEARGYTCWPLVVGAVHAGAPHERKRAWFIAADADQVGRPHARKQRARQGKPRRTIAAHSAANNLHADQDSKPHMPVDGEVARGMGLPGDADEAVLEIGQGERRDFRSQLAALERAVGPLGARWHGGAARSFGMAAGLPAGLARQCVAAYGDSVLPQITEAIGHAIRRTEEALRAAT